MLKTVLCLRFNFPFAVYADIVLFALNLNENVMQNIIGNYHSSIFPKADVDVSIWGFLFPFDWFSL